MGTFMAFGLRAFPLIAMAFVLIGCPGTDLRVGGPDGAVVPEAGSPPHPPWAGDLSLIDERLRELKRGQARRAEEARETILQIKSEVERTRKDSEAALDKVGEAVAKLKRRIERLENQVDLLRSRAAAAFAREQERLAVPAGESSKMPPVGAPHADARVPSAGRPESQDVLAVPPPLADARVTVIPQIPTIQPKTPVSTPRPVPEEDYAQAIRALRDERNFTKARELLSAFIAEHPTHELADDAQYWIGQSYFQEKNFERAILAFNKVQVDYANGDKAPESLLLEAFSFLNLGDRASARELLGRVISKYPDSVAALTARGQLDAL